MFPKPKIVWALFLGAFIGLRIAFYFGTPLLDNDSTVVFFGAREFAHSGVSSKVNTLPVLLVGLLYKIFGEHILLARLPQFLGGIGCVALIWLIGQKATKYAGAIGALVFAVLPLATLYGSITKPYSLIAFFVLLGAYLYSQSVEKNKIHFSIFAGISFAAAFLCYTFAASSGFPLAVLFILGIFFKRYRPHLKPALVSGLTFGFCLSLIVLWRWEEFGWSITNDYVTDWRFDVATAVWAGRWVGLADVWSLGIAIFIPGIVLIAFNRDSLKNLGPFATYGLIFCGMNVLVWFFNPVNHFPRVLLPSLPFLALFAGSIFNRLFEKERKADHAIAWIVSILVGTLVMYPGFRNANLPLWLFNPQTFQGISLTLLALFLLSLLALAIFYPLRKVRLGSVTIWAPVFLIALGSLGTTMSWKIVQAQAAIFQSRAELVRMSSVTGLLGGGDYSNLARPSPKTVPFITDFEPEEFDRIISGDFIGVLKDRGISHVIWSRNDPEGVRAMLAGMFMEKGLKVTEMPTILRDLIDMNNAYHIADNDYGALLRILDVVPEPYTQEELKRLKAYETCPAMMPRFTSLEFIDVEAGKVRVRLAAPEKGASLKAFYYDDDQYDQIFQRNLYEKEQEITIPLMKDKQGKKLQFRLDEIEEDVKDFHRDIMSLIPEKEVEQTGSETTEK